MEDTQLMKGILEGCILGVIYQGETYGYEILSILEKCGFDNISEGTLYPVLTRLNKNGFISCRKAKSPLGPVRKYYKITEEGRIRYEAFKKNYKKIVASADIILFGENPPETKEEEHGKLSD